jgi:hypothetical protein
MIIIFLFFIALQACFASGMDAARDSGVSAALSATEAGKGAFSAENASGFSSLKSWGISVNPDYQQSTNPQEIEEQASRTFNTDETAQLIKKSHQTRELVQIDLDHIQIDGDGLIKNMGDGHLDGEETYEIRTCRTPGENYTAVCKRQRLFEVKVTPSTLAHVRHCGGHTESRAWGTKHVLRHYSDCGCGSYWTGSPRKVELMNERWVGCESEDRNHEDGLCELIEERPGPHNETRMIDGESFTRDYWETTRAYRCGARVGKQ